MERRLANSGDPDRTLCLHHRVRTLQKVAVKSHAELVGARSHRVGTCAGRGCLQPDFLPAPTKLIETI